MSFTPIHEASGANPHALTPELARTNPADFTHDAILALGEHSEYGGDAFAYVWETAPRMWLYPGGRSSIDISVDPYSWGSSSNIGNGTIRLGAGPMGREERDGVRYLDDQFDYGKNATYRLLHEADHFLDAIALRQGTAAMRGLDQAVHDIRRDNQGLRGLSALGSVNPHGLKSVASIFLHA